MKQTIEDIKEDKSFLSKRIISSISDYKKCLDKFSNNFENEISLNTETPIFLDTNVLLRYYSISFTARLKLFSFLKKNSHRIYITTQVQTEYLRNREDIIQRFYDQVTSKIPRDFNSDIVNKMRNFLEQHKIVLKDYPFVEPGIEKYSIELEGLLKKLNEAVDLKKKEHMELVFKDELLDFLSNCKQGDILNETEILLIKKQFDFLSKDITPEKIESLINKISGVFPGLGDIKNKPEDPYGDYIIFHEMMKYMANKKSDIIFLTFDTTKGDWMTKTKLPYLHYIQNMYANTGQIIYICDAERSFGELLNIEVESLVPATIENSNIITSASLMEFARKSPVFKGAYLVEFNSPVLQELKFNGYSTMFEIESEIKNFEYAIMKYREKNKKLNSVGILRSGLRIANRNYVYEINAKDGLAYEISPDRINVYRRYADMLPI